MVADLPLISVIIPTIGRPKFIRQTIIAALTQDYPRLEILISDNAPSVPTKKLVADLNYERLRIIERPERLESAIHFTRCLEDAAGEFVMFLSDDDLIQPNYISEMYKGMSRDAQVKVCLGTQKIIDESQSDPPEASPETNQIQIHPGPRFFLNKLLRPKMNSIVTYVSLFARRSELLANGGWRNYPDGSNSDNYAFFRLAMQGKVALAPTVMFYRVYSTSVGLGTPFWKLTRSCADYEGEVREWLRANPSRSPALIRILLPSLIRIRNTRMMTNRLFRLYLRRLAPKDFATACLLLLRYAFGHVPQNEAAIKS